MLKRSAMLLLTFTFILIIWEFYVGQFEERRFVLPAPSQIIERIWENPGRLLWHSIITLEEMIVSCILAFSFAFPIAWIMFKWKTARFILQPFLIAIQCIPVFALAPMMILWFDWTFLAIAIPSALMVFFPFVTSIYQGLCSTPTYYIDFFRIHRATDWQFFYKLQLPWAIPHICGGLRISIAISGICAIAGEWAGAQHGLGVLMLESRRTADLITAFAALGCLTFLSLSLYCLCTIIEKLTLARQALKFKIKKWLKGSTIFLILSLMLGISGCGQHSDSRQEIRLLLDWLPNPNHVPLYAGLKEGFFSREGIQLAIYKNQASCNTLPYLMSEKVDLAVSYPSYILRAKDHEADLKYVGMLIKCPLNAILFRNEDSITTPQDLTGRVVGCCTDGGISEDLKILMQLNHINPKEYKNVNFDLVGMFMIKRVDALFEAYWNIEREHFRHLGVDVGYFTMDQLGVPSYPELIIVTSYKFFEKSILQIEKFRKALQASIDFSLQHPNEAFQAYIEANPDKSNDTQEWEKKAWLATLPALATQQQFDEEIWRRYYEWMYCYRLLSHQFDVMSLKSDLHP